MNFELHDRFREEKLEKKRAQYIRDLLKPRGEQSAQEMWRVLPTEIWLLIFTFVHQWSLTSQVCRGWYGITRHLATEKTDYLDRYNPDTKERQSWFLKTLVSCNVDKFLIVKKAFLSGELNFIKRAIEYTRYTEKEFNQNLHAFTKLAVNKSVLLWLLRKIVISDAVILEVLYFHKCMDSIIEWVNSGVLSNIEYMLYRCVAVTLREDLMEKLLYNCKCRLDDNYGYLFNHYPVFRNVLVEYISDENAISTTFRDPGRFIGRVFRGYNSDVITSLIYSYHKKKF